MQTLYYCVFLISSICFSQSVIETSLISKTELKDASYANIQLGNISSINAFNTLKISVFYQQFNSAVILDNRLNEIYRIEFNNLTPYRNITHISAGNDNTLWLYNQDTQQLEVYDYKQNLNRVKTLPLSDRVLDLKSNYNAAWALTEKQLISYNYFGSVISKIENQGYTELTELNDNIILKKGNALHYLAQDATETVPIDYTN